MKRQVIFNDDQLVEMVNESAKRVLRGLMTEVWYKPWTWFGGDDDNSEADEIMAAFSNGQNNGMLNQIGGDNIVKLYQANPEAFQVISQDPMLLAQIAGNPGVADKMASDPSFMTKLATNPNVQSTFFANGPEQAMNFFSDENMVNIMKNPDIDPQTRAQMYGMMNGQVPMDPMMMQNIMAQYQTQNVGNDNGGWGGMISRLLGIPQQPQQPSQYTDDQAQMFLQGISDVDQQILQYQQMLKANPNDIAAKQNLALLQQQKAFYQPFVQNYGQQVNNDLQKLKAQIQNGQVPLNPQTMMQMQALQQKVMDLNTGYGQYLQQTQSQTSGNTANGNQNQSSRQGFLWDMMRGNNNQQTSGAANSNVAGNMVGNAKNMVNGAIKNINANQRQQKPAATRRRQSRPAVTPAAASTTPAVAATPAATTPTPQAPSRTMANTAQQTLANNPATGQISGAPKRVNNLQNIGQQMTQQVANNNPAMRQMRNMNMNNPLGQANLYQQKR